MVKFAKNGSIVVTAAVKLARAYTGRPYVMLCKDHPFFSYDDWFIGTTPMQSGVDPDAVKHSLTFRYNDIESVEALFNEHGKDIACLVMEAVTYEEPRDDFLHKVQKLCREHGAVFIIDEMISGFRWHVKGAAHYFGLEPDLSTFGKGIANGFSVAALVGRREIMDLGGLFHDKERVFLISTTHGAENHALAACRASLSIYRSEPVVEHLWSIGGQLVDGLNEAARKAGLADYFGASGYPCSPVYVCRDKSGDVSLPMRTLFLQEMVRHGVLANYICPSYSHGVAEVEETLSAAEKALAVYAKALEDGWEGYLEGPVIKPVFRKFN